MRAVRPALIGLLGFACDLGCALASHAGRVVHHQMAETARKRGGIDLPAVFATTLAAFHQHQQRSVAAWDAILEDFEDDLELDAPDDEASRAVKRRRVFPRKDRLQEVGLVARVGGADGDRLDGSHDQGSAALSPELSRPLPFFRAPGGASAGARLVSNGQVGLHWS